MRAILVVAALAIGLTGCQEPGHMKTTDGYLKGYKAYSWGKADVSYDDYDKTAYDCTLEGVRAQVQSHAPETIATPTGPNVGHGMADDYTVSGVLSDKDARDRDVYQQRQVVVDNCLLGQGYRKFGLTDEQLGKLQYLAPGSTERRHYLWSLASDPAILAKQAI